MQVTRIHADPGGHTHFEAVEVAFTSVDFAPPTPPLLVSSFEAASHYAFCRFPAGWVGSWHRTPERQCFAILSGEVELQTSDGEVRRFAAGSCVIVEDTSGDGHVTRVLGSADVLTLVVQMPALSG